MVVMSKARRAEREQNAFELGRDYERGQHAPA